MARTSAERRWINKEIPMNYRHEDRWKNKKVIRIIRPCQSFLGGEPPQASVTLDPNSKLPSVMLFLINRQQISFPAKDLRPVIIAYRQLSAICLPR